MELYVNTIMIDQIMMTALSTTQNMFVLLCLYGYKLWFGHSFTYVLRMFENMIRKRY